MMRVKIARGRELNENEGEQNSLIVDRLKKFPFFWRLKTNPTATRLVSIDEITMTILPKTGHCLSFGVT